MATLHVDPFHYFALSAPQLFVPPLPAETPALEPPRSPTPPPVCPDVDLTRDIAILWPKRVIAVRNLRVLPNHHRELELYAEQQEQHCAWISTGAFSVDHLRTLMALFLC